MIALAPHVSSCLVGGRLIFLDVKRNRYFMASERAGAALLFPQFAADGTTTNRNLLANLVTGGVLVESEGAGTFQAPAVDIPEKSALDTVIMPTNSADVAKAIISRWRASRLLKRHRLHQILENIQQRRRHLPTTTDATRMAVEDNIVSGFQNARRFIKFKDRCLPNSIAMALRLQARGVDGRIVFGVKVNPFEAHCWVQTTRLLNDTADHARLFTPILAI